MKKHMQIPMVPGMDKVRMPTLGEQMAENASAEDGLSGRVRLHTDPKYIVHHEGPTHTEEEDGDHHGYPHY